MNQNDASKKDNDNSNQLDTELIGSYQSITIGFSKDVNLPVFQKLVSISTILLEALFIMKMISLTHSLL
ncbi:TPA: hypothetical protein ACRQ8V_003139 [Legionella pneumophila]